MKTVKLNREIELIVSGIGAAQGIFWGVNALLTKKRDFKNILFAIVFISVSFRIIKSLAWVYKNDISIWFINFGFIAHSVFAPALFLYVYYSLMKTKWKNLSFLHFFPPLFLLLFMSSITLENFWYQGGYTFLLFHQIIYTLISGALLVNKFLQKSDINSLPKVESNWLIILVLGAFFLQMAYFSNYVLGLTPYLLGPVIYAAFVYVTSFYVFRYSKQLFENEIRKSVKVKDVEILRIKQLLLDHIKDEKSFLNPRCTLDSMAKEMHIQPYQLSYVLNESFMKSFPDFLNELRIGKAKELLIQKNEIPLKISGIAYDCGYNSLSSFNSAFKKITKVTPSKYRESMMDS
ncbi:MAG: AraC family transcriptional regulator [Flavobacteriaceae bacterium]|nr:AraC family transcriptional regulator [Flavobacteriaceae bacterium]